jgi:predicted nucleic acid-binding Zn ribbon protein
MYKRTAELIPRIRKILVPCPSKERDGVIYHWQLNPARVVGRPVRVLDERSKPDLPIWDDHFLDTADVMEAITRQDNAKAAQLIRGQLQDEDLSKEIVKQPLSYVAANLVSGMEGAQFTVWWNEREQRLDLGIYCERQRPAAYASLLRAGLYPFPVARCKECGKRFPQDSRQEKDYCSPKCRNTWNVRNSRKRARMVKGKAKRRRAAA